MKASGAKVIEHAGLYPAGGERPVPLLGVRARAEVAGFGSRVTLTQRYRNEEAVPIEAVYVFPVPEGAAVCGLAMIVGERRIEAAVRPRDEAFEVYDDALADGHGAVLVDVERPNVLTASIGNVLPGQEVTVELRWVAELPREGEAVRFMLPATVAPRYAPAADRRGVSPTPAEAVSPPVVLEAPYGFDLAVDVAFASPVRAVDSPSHPVRVELDGRRARVTLAHGAAAMDRDFVLLVTPGGEEAAALAERGADGVVTAAVSVVPRLEGGGTNAEVVFLVDRSGSMSGSSMEQVRSALQLCLRSLREGDRFDVVGFGSTFQALFGVSRPYGQDALDAAAAAVDAMEADLGGTELLPALASVLEREPLEGLAREVVLLTDGEVTDEAAVAALAARHRGHARVFTFGIGFGASEFLVRAVARAAGGEAEMIHPGERVGPKVLRQFARLSRAGVRDLRVEWEGCTPSLLAPAAPPAVFDGEAVTLYARFETTRPVAAVLSGTVGGRPVRWSVAVDPAGAPEGTLLATLAARAAIRDLEEGAGGPRGEGGGSAQEERRRGRVRNAVVDLATAYGLASTCTSFVAVERRETTAGAGGSELRRIPVALTHGWGGVGGVSGAQAIYGMPISAPLPAAAARDADHVQFSRRRGITPAEPLDGAPLVRKSLRLTPPPVQGTLPGLLTAPGAGRKVLPHVTLARLQRAEGSWRLDAELAAAVGAAPAALESVAAGLGVGPVGGALVATAAALRFLRVRCAAHESEWALLAAKAARWLGTALAAAGNAPTPRELDALLAAAVGRGAA